MRTDRRSLIKMISGAAPAAVLAGCASLQEQGSPTATPNDGENTDPQSTEETPTAGPSGNATAWYGLSEDELALRENVIETFNDQSDHTIRGENISEMQDQTTSAIPAGQGPHTFQWAHDWVGDYYDRGFLVDQSDQLSVELDQFSNAAAEAVQYDDAVVGLPFAAETVTFIYNTDIVDEEPETFEDMRTVMDEYHDPSSGQYGLAFPIDPYFASGIGQAFGGYYFDPQEDPMVGLDSEETIRGFEFLADELAPYMPNDPGYEPQQSAFAQGNAAFAINGPWYLATLNDNDVPYEVSTFPTINGGEFTPLTGITVWYFSKAMEDDDADTAASREFIEWYVTNRDHLLVRAEEQGHIPVLSDLVGSDELPGPVNAYSQAVDQGIPMPTDPRLNDVFAAMESPVEQIFTGSQSPEAALSNAAEQARSQWE